MRKDGIAISIKMILAHNGSEFPPLMFGKAMKKIAMEIPAPTSIDGSLIEFVRSI